MPRLLIFAALCLVLAVSSMAAAQAGVVAHRDLNYVHRRDIDPARTALDVYTADGAEGRPVIVMIHGGGWRTGDKANAAMTRHKSSHFVGEGYIYVSANYPLTSTPGDPKHPAHVQGVAAALAWVHDNIDTYGGDPDRIFVMGHSAGAHLAALVATNPAPLAAHNKPLTIIKGTICLDSAAYDIPRSMNELRIGPSMRRTYENAFGHDEAAWRDASPRHHVASGVGISPMLLFHTGERMQGRLLSEDMTAALRTAGVPALVVHAADQDHAGINMVIGQPSDRYTNLIMRFLADPSRASELSQLDPEPDPIEDLDPRESDRLRATFDRLDRDGDSHLSREEYARLRRAPATHEAIDADRDGLLTMAEVVTYARRERPRKPQTPSDGRGAADDTSAVDTKTVTAHLTAHSDYLPGAIDANGHRMGGTETMRLVAHDNMLFAAIGFWTDPRSIATTGGQILAKTGPKEPWQVEASFLGSARINAMEPITFCTDWRGEELPSPVTLLLADAGMASARDGGPLVVQVRHDATGRWIQSTITAQAPRAFVRAFGAHRDAATGVDLVLAGTGAGEIYAGGYDPSAPGGIRWASAPEHRNPAFDGDSYKRVSAFCVANGAAYASVSPELVRRVDGPEPRWEPVYKWQPREGRPGAGLRGITAVPALDGEHEVVLGAREDPGLILRIDPFRDHEASIELDVRAFTREHLGTMRGGRLTAYNRFVPGRHPVTGEPIHWITLHGMALDQPAAAWLLIRDASTGYQLVRVHDPDSDRKAPLVSTRTIEPSPWDSGSLYTGGYDGAANDRRNADTAWIYRLDLTPKQ